MKIDSFSGEYQFLSNFYVSPFTFLGKLAATAEHHYQAAKASKWQDKIAILDTPTPGKAKRMGQTVEMWPDWEDQKLFFMERILRTKFAPGTQLAEQLLATGDAWLEEGNHWGDTFWGVCNGQGQNHLGHLLMEIRTNLKEDQ